MINDSPAAGIYELTDWEKPTAVVIGSTRHGKSGRVQVGTLGGSLLSGVREQRRGRPARLRRQAIRSGSDRRRGRRLLAVLARPLRGGYLAERANARLAILSVMGPPHYVLGGLLSPLGPEEYREYKEKEWESVYEEAAGRVPDGVAPEPLLLHGEPAEALAEAASDLDLLLLGSRGYGPVKGTLLGSVSARVMAAAPCPVMVVPRGAGATPLEA